jgi:hypothetical protein
MSLTPQIFVVVALFTSLTDFTGWVYGIFTMMRNIIFDQ